MREERPTIKTVVKKIEKERTEKRKKDRKW